MKILIIDGQSGRLGGQLIERLINAGVSNKDLIAIGTNSMATNAMLKAGADRAATGENPIVVQSASADIIAGPIGIVIANALLGEITPTMAVAVGTSAAEKVLLPVNRCGTTIVGMSSATLSQLIDIAVETILKLSAENC